jgi:hypothetical protein
MADENKTETTTTNTPDPWEAAKAAAAKAGLTPDDIIKAVTEPPVKQQQTPATPNIDDRVNEGIAKWSHGRVVEEETEASAAAIAALTNGVEGDAKELREVALIDAISKARSTYPTGHPLAGQPKPLSAAQIEAIKAKVASGFAPATKPGLAAAIKGASAPARPATPAAGARSTPAAEVTYATERERLNALTESKKAAFLAKLAESAQ